jgi:hypothetical protein
MRAMPREANSIILEETPYLYPGKCGPEHVFSLDAGFGL